MPEKLTSFGIRGFRALSHLDIDGLGAVNLFVGKNNTGKTSVLEALRIFFSGDPRLQIFNLLATREEFAISRKIRLSGADSADTGTAISFEALFSGRPDLVSGPRFSLGPLPDPAAEGLTVRFVRLQRDETNEDFPVRYRIVRDSDGDIDTVPGYAVNKGGKTNIGPLDRFARATMRRRLGAADIDQDVVYLPSSGMTMREIGATWDTIALTDEEDEVVKALRIIAPDLEKLVLIQSPQEPNQRMLMSKLSTFPHPVPFKSLGEGTVHLLGLVLSMIQAKNGVVLFDEVENGVHYSVQDAMWKLIMDQSIKFNVQVFATTHSWDCVSGFQSAAITHPSHIASLFRLERDGDLMKVVTFSPEEVGIAKAESIEIR